MDDEQLPWLRLVLVMSPKLSESPKVDISIDSMEDVTVELGAPILPPAMIPRPRLPGLFWISEIYVNCLHSFPLKNSIVPRSLLYLTVPSVYPLDLFLSAVSPTGTEKWCLTLIHSTDPIHAVDPNPTVRVLPVSTTISPVVLYSPERVWSLIMVF